MSCVNTKNTVILDWLHNPDLADTTGQCAVCFELLHIIDSTPAYDECIDNHPDAECGGQVKYRMSLSPSGKNFPRCDSHWAVRLKNEDEINKRYPKQAPADFDPAYAGERWEEE